MVCKATDQASRLDGFYNNALFRVQAVQGPDGRDLTLVEDLSGATCDATAYIEDLDGMDIPFETIPFRFGYCLTAHTAQGGEWPEVVIDQTDLRCFAGYCWHTDRQNEIDRWSYTALTRAKERVVLLTTYQFC